MRPPVWRAAQYLGVSRWQRPGCQTPSQTFPCAYALWDAAGRPEGRSEEFYFRAEEEFRHLLESHLNPTDH